MADEECQLKAGHLPAGKRWKIVRRSTGNRLKPLFQLTDYFFANKRIAFLFLRHKMPNLLLRLTDNQKLIHQSPFSYHFQLRLAVCELCSTRLRRRWSDQPRIKRTALASRIRPTLTRRWWAEHRLRGTRITRLRRPRWRMQPNRPRQCPTSPCLTSSSPGSSRQVLSIVSKWMCVPWSI